MIIRPYQNYDFGGIVDVVRAVQVTDCWPQVYPNGWNEERIREEFRPLDNYKNSLFLVSEEQGEITGLIAGHDLKPFVENEIPHLKSKLEVILPSYYQRDIIIAPQSQRGTLGLRFFREMVKYAKSKKYKNLVTRTPPLNSRGIKFFERIGYHEIFRDNNPERLYFSMKLD